MVSGTERLYWFCQLVAYGHSSSEAKRILDEAIEKTEKGIRRCPACGEEVENGEDGMLEHHTVCEGEK